jgi:hypothetical protein
MNAIFDRRMKEPFGHGHRVATNTWKVSRAAVSETDRTLRHCIGAAVAVRISRIWFQSGPSRTPRTFPLLYEIRWPIRSLLLLSRSPRVA